MSKRPFYYGIAFVLAVWTSSAAFGYETELGIGLFAGFNDNVANAVDSARQGSAFGRSTLDLTMDWGSKTSNGAMFLNLGVDNDSYPDSGIEGNVSYEVNPGFRFHLLDRALASALSYRFSNGTSYALSTALLGGASGRKGGVGTLSSAGSDFTTEGFLGNELSWKSEYSWSEYRAGASIKAGTRSYNESGRKDSLLSLEASGGGAAFSSDFSFGFGLEKLSSDLSGYSYSGPYLYGLGLFPVSDAVSFSLLLRSGARSYADSAGSQPRDDRLLTIEGAVDLELSSSLSLEMGIGRTSNNSSVESNSFASVETSAGLLITF